MSYESSLLWEEVTKTAIEAGLEKTIPKRLAHTTDEMRTRERQRKMLSHKSYLVPELPWKKEKINER